jgi:hypothetical protein
LFRVGRLESIGEIATRFGVGDGSTITRFTRRVFQALLAVKGEWVTWPDAEERRAMYEESLGPGQLEGIILFMDGTHVHLRDKPGIDHEIYYDREQNYSIQLQLIVDRKKRIRHYFTGFPGSQHDSFIFRNCDINPTNLHEFLHHNEIIGADKGYPLLRHVLTPFRENSPDAEEFGIPQQALREFNRHYSGLRVVVEHVNGLLKEELESLKLLPIPINSEQGHRDAVEWIEGCCVLYNMLRSSRLEDEERRQQTPDTEEDANENVRDDQDGDNEGNIAEEDSTEEGRLRRIEVVRRYLRRL